MGELVEISGEAARIIAGIDDVLRTVRLLWLEAPPRSPDRRKYLEKMNGLLDQRLNMMRLRDATSS